MITQTILKDYKMADDKKDDSKKCDLKDIFVCWQSSFAQFAAYAFCALIITHPPDLSNSAYAGAFGMIITFVIGESKNWSSYWTNTTRSSADKDKAIANMASAANQTQAGTTTTTTTETVAPKQTIEPQQLKA